jgi:starvation-inducible DNA-binding protein
MEDLEELDLVTQDMLIDHTAELEKFQWFVRAHLESASGTIPT